MRALRLLIGASAVTYLFRCRRPRDPSYICVRYGSRDAVALRAGRGAHQASGLGCRQPGVSGSFTWTPIGPIRHPLAFDRLPRLAGYTIYLPPTISRRDEEGFSSYSVCPCHRAVAFTPPR